MGITAEIALASANKYTEETVVGGGAIKGKNCTIQSITEITGGHRVAYKWTLDNGTEQTAYMDVMNGEKGETGAQGPTGATGSQGPAGADGSVVTVTQTLSSGTKIAEIDVDGTTTNLFAPSGGGGTTLVTQFEVATSGWTADSTTQSGATLYKKSIALTQVDSTFGVVAIGSTGTLPTKAQQTAFDLVQYVTIDSAVPCLYLYASAIPTDSFYIKVEGVS